MKSSDRLITLQMARIGIMLVLVWFTISNFTFMILMLVALYQRIFLDMIITFYITPPWFPFLSVPGMFLLFWLYRKVSKQYNATAREIDVPKNG